MPKQPGDKPKSVRQKYVIEAVEKFGTASVKQIIQSVSSRMDVQPDANFKRNLERDLDQLTDVLGVKYFYPNEVDEIPLGEEENVRNKRKRYYILGGSVHLEGGNLLKEHQVEFFPQKLDLPKWFVTNLRSERSGKVHVVFQTGLKFGSINAFIEDLPFKVVIGRQIGKKNLKGAIENIQLEYGNKASILLLNGNDIQRWVSFENVIHRHGHALIEFESSGNKIRISDICGKGVHFKKVDKIALKIYGRDIKDIYERKDDMDFSDDGRGDNNHREKYFRTPIGILVAMSEWQKIESIPPENDLIEQEGVFAKEKKFAFADCDLPTVIKIGSNLIYILKT